MADFARLLFRKPVQKKIGSIEIDAFTEEDHSRTSSITRYPLEDGAQASDHIVNDPERVTITGIVSSAKLISFGFDIVANRAINAFRELNDLMDRKELVTIVTGLKVYSDMHIEDFQSLRNRRNGGALSFSMALQAAKIVTTQTVEIPNTIVTGDAVTQAQAQSEADVGKVTDGQSLLLDALELGLESGRTQGDVFSRATGIIQ